MSVSSPRALSSSGIDLDQAVAHKAEHQTVVGLPETMTITNEDLLVQECDILVPAAIANQITGANAAQIKAKLIVEGANAPTTPRADDILLERGIEVLPDILANAGGVTVSYFEWVQNTDNEEWEHEEIIRRLRRRMYRAVDSLVSTRREINAANAAGAATENNDSDTGSPDITAHDGVVDLRTAALISAIRRVATVTLERGIWP
jgi:glutamate dehydrogenase (NAD(P)+)